MPTPVSEMLIRAKPRLWKVERAVPHIRGNSFRRESRSGDRGPGYAVEMNDPQESGRSIDIIPFCAFEADEPVERIMAFIDYTNFESGRHFLLL